MTYLRLLKRILCMLLVVQLIAPASILTAANQGEAPSKTLEITQNAFSPAMDPASRDLLADYIDYLLESAKSRQAFRDVSSQLNDFLAKNQAWDDVVLSDQDLAALLEEYRTTRDYVVEKGIPVEDNLIAKQDGLEQELKASVEAVNASGQAPNGLMNSARTLEYLYNLHDQYWPVKKALLAKMLEIQKAVYAEAEWGENGAGLKTASLGSHMGALESYIKTADTHHQQSLAHQKSFQKIEDRFNQKVAAELGREESRTRSLIQEIDRHVNNLNRAGGDNEGRHADLLSEVNTLLGSRIELIQNRLAEVNRGQSEQQNFLYVPDRLRQQPATSDLTAEYAEITGGFVAQTGKRVELARQLAETVATAREALETERQQVLECLERSADLSDDVLSASKEMAQRHLDRFQEDLIIVASDLQDVGRLAQPIDFSNPAAVMGSRQWSADVIQINQLLEEILFRAQDIKLMSVALDFQLAKALLPSDTGGLQESSAFVMLDDANVLRIDKIDEITDILNQIRDTYKADADILLSLRQYGKKLIERGQSAYSQKREAYNEFLFDHKESAGKPYYDYLTGVSEDIRQTEEDLSAIASLFPADFEARLSDQQCPDCEVNPELWSNLAAFGSSFSNVLDQLNNLYELAPYFSAEKLNTASIYENAQNLFDISRLIQKPPFLNLHNDSLDVVFYSGEHLVAVKGIGNPEQVELAAYLSPRDHFTHPPYIGAWGFNPLKAFNKGFSKITSVVSSTASGLARTARDVIDTAAEYGGKVATGVARQAANVRDGIKKVASATGDFVSATFKGAKDWMVNTGKAAILSNEEGEFSWKNVDWWKVGGLALTGAACAATGGLACAAIAGGALLAKGAVETLDNKEYGVLTQDQANYINLGIDLATVVVGGLQNIKGVAGKSGSMTQGIKNFMKMSGSKKLSTFFLGISDDIIGHSGLRGAYQALRGGKGIVKALNKLNLGYISKNAVSLANSANSYYNNLVTILNQAIGGSGSTPQPVGAGGGTGQGIGGRSGAGGKIGGGAAAGQGVGGAAGAAGKTSGQGAAGQGVDGAGGSGVDVTGGGGSGQQVTGEGGQGSGVSGGSGESEGISGGSAAGGPSGASGVGGQQVVGTDGAGTPIGGESAGGQDVAGGGASGAGVTGDPGAGAGVSGTGVEGEGTSAEGGAGTVLPGHESDARDVDSEASKLKPHKVKPHKVKSHKIKSHKIESHSID